MRRYTDRGSQYNYGAREMSEAATESVLPVAFYRVLKALAKVALRYGFSIGAFTELVRRAYVDAAEETLHDSGKQPFMSRVCVLTGLYRKEVVRIKGLPPLHTEALDDKYNRWARVITGWIRDSRFLTRAHRPAVLKMEGADNSFTELVKRYSGDMTPRAVLEELLRLQVVERTRNNGVRLLERAYVPSDDERGILQMLGVDTADLINTIAFNINRPVGERRFQRKVSYVHIPERHLQDFSVFAARQSQHLLETLDGWLDERDTEPLEDGTPGASIGLGIYQIFNSNNEHSREPDPAAPANE
jgi:hypothetical protein